MLRGFLVVGAAEGEAEAAGELLEAELHPFHGVDAGGVEHDAAAGGARLAG